MIHELVHLATPTVFERWFEEGTAYWIAGHITDRHSGREWEDFRATVGDYFDSDEETPEEYRRNIEAGYLFYVDLAAIIGPEGVGQHIRGVVEGAYTGQILASIVRVTPPDKLAQVRDLIRQRCRSGPEDKPVPCAIASR